ncbi:hypothetical protein BBK36DRAFT_1109263 [Trichoderma citrinoviride]|uniref:Diaminohydroxyphosphoribosylamino-pyrimidine deaminase n=1 Tax=Trichoderma citrinoviride TaxID=58853 RepID=A0A2T4BNP7_9HYPO|nr:hypothetical protein BBK36DRAFT_1109263 [Trichoderma citrinoviride]PTB70943.1 hypothetical protein BBK36DRAFT_1109263 [Trichoderma citrinoviride]
MANSLQDLLSNLEDEIQDPDEETFLLYANTTPLEGLGFIDSRATTLDLQLNGKDVTIHQSPGVLASSRKGGTTGAVLWKITPLFAEWLSSPNNPLTPFFTKSASSIVELGCGISPLNALSLSRRGVVSRYILTDQPYVQKLVLQNLAANLNSSGRAKKSSTTTPKSPSPPSSVSPLNSTMADIHFQVLDWETSQVTPALTHSPSTSSFDALISCDCVFNYALIPPFVQTCVDICNLRNQQDNSTSLLSREKNQDSDRSLAPPPPCLCIVAQQLRNDDVFNTWLTAFMKHFRVWRVPGERMPAELRPEAGFAVHVGVLKDSLSLDTRIP